MQLNEAQIIQRNWENDTNINRSIYSRFHRLQEEYFELEDAVVNGDCLRAIADEAADVIIIALGVVDETGFDIERVFTEKMQRNWEKYPPDKIEKLMDEGMTNQEAMAQCKKEWNSGLR